VAGILCYSFTSFLKSNSGNNMKVLVGLLLLLVVDTVLLAEPVSVTVKPLDKLWRPQSYNVPAEVLSVNHAKIGADISAAVVAVPINVGDEVEKGDLLVKQDCEIYLVKQQINRASLERSTAQLAFARSQLARANNLNKKQSISAELLDQRRTELKVAQADKVFNEQSLAMSKIEAGNCEVTAPFDAVVTGRMVSVGDYANTGQAMVSLLDLNAIEVEADLSRSEINALKRADAIVFDSGNETLEVKLRTVIPVFDRQSATAKVRLVFKNKIMPWPGSEGRLKWQSRQALLPAEFITLRDKRLGVFHVVEGKAVFSSLDTALEGRPSAVDLPANTAIVLQGRHRLNDGDTVIVVNDN
jgi:RND family efflux transporter MFP subunit